MEALLKDKTALITGSGRGIGFQIARLFAERGATIVLSDYNEDSLKDAKRYFTEQHFPFLAIPCNVTDPENVQTLVDSVVEKYSRIDILINNAGITRDTLLMRMKDEQWKAVLETNLSGVFYTCRASLKYFMKQRSGKIINISSVVGLIGNIGQTNYAASKAGVIGFSKSLARELAPRNVNVNVIAPGFIDTAMTEKLPEKVKEEFLKQIPLSRMGKPEDVANVALFLASSFSDYLTGQVIHVDGGMVM